jgi:uncharacterized protein with ParB-like and HNH nuclease domain
MDAPKTIREMLSGNRIFVPSYQRAYSWDTEFNKEKSPKQINVFFSDIDELNILIALQNHLIILDIFFLKINQISDMELLMVNNV